MNDEEKKKEDTPDDVVFEETEEAKKDAAALVHELKEKLTSCQKERQVYLHALQRAKADYINAQKEEERTRAEFVKFSREELIRELLPSLNSFHIAFGNKSAWEKVDINWRLGVQHIYTQLRSVLEKNAVSFIEPAVGDRFDPRTHSSVETVPVAKPEDDHTIREVVLKGFALHGKIVQPAQVRVGKYAASRTDADSTRTEAEIT